MNDVYFAWGWLVLAATVFFVFGLLVGLAVQRVRVIYVEPKGWWD